MKSEGNSYEGRGVLEAHGYTCVIDGTVVSVKPPTPFHQLHIMGCIC